MYFSPFFLFLAVFVLADIGLLFLYVVKKNKAALYASLILFVILLGIIIWITPVFEAVSPAPESVEITTPADGNTSQTSLTTKKWSWISAKNTDGKIITPNKPDIFTLTFNQDGRVIVGTDCNNMSGSYTVNNNALVLSEMASTLMYCDGSQEQEFSSLLMTVNGYKITDKGELVLSSPAESELMNFR